MLKKLIAAVLTAASLATSAAACPNIDLRPYFGTINLASGFMPDPYRRSVTAGGTNLMSRCGFDAQGFVTTRPDFSLYWSGNASQLTFAIESYADSILLVNAPNYDWYFDDDTYGYNPVVRFVNPIPGRYDLWIGSYDGSRRNPATLVVTEYDY